MRIALFSVLAFLVVACAARPPVQEMSDARQAVAAAVDAGAKEHYPDLLDEATLRLQRAEKNMRSGVYSLAKRDAAVAKDLAIDALLSTRREVSGEIDADAP